MKNSEKILIIAGILGMSLVIGCGSKESVSVAQPEMKQQESQQETTETTDTQVNEKESESAQEQSSAAYPVPDHSASLTDRALTVDGIDLHVPCNEEDVKALKIEASRYDMGFYDVYDDKDANISVQGIFKDFMNDAPGQPYYSVNVKMLDTSKPVGRHVVVDGCELGVMTLDEFDKKYPNPDRAFDASSIDTTRDTKDAYRVFYLSESDDTDLTFTFNDKGLLCEISINLLHEGEEGMR